MLKFCKNISFIYFLLINLINCELTINEDNIITTNIGTTTTTTAIGSSVGVAATTQVTSFIPTTTTTQIINKKLNCFNADHDLCFNKNDENFLNATQCECHQHPHVPYTIYCCNVTDIERSLSCVQPLPLNLQPTDEQYPQPSTTIINWKNIHIINANLEKLNLSNRFFNQLISLSITDGGIMNISSYFSKFTSIKCLNISNNNIMEIDTRALRYLYNLQILDISNNSMSIMPKINHLNNLTLDIRRNNRLLCKSVQEAIEHGGFTFVEPDSTYCLINHTFNWFNSTDTIPIRQLERRKQLQTECPHIPGYGNCTCEAERMNYEAQEQPGESHLVLRAKVDCSNLGLTELPNNLPNNTLTLNVSNNNIKNLSAIKENVSYKEILRFYADDNEISSLVDLEGSNLIKKFDKISLRRNKIKQIPIYLFNSLDRNPSGHLLYLGGNQLTCNCDTATSLRMWLVSQHNHIIDYEDILCDNEQQQRVVDLNKMKVCQSQHVWTDYIYYLIALEILLLLALIMKVSYDYWIFKTAGYLPWPASKMPKLPCDCLCES